VLRINGKQALKLLESDPVSGYVAMRRLAGLIARFLAAAGAK
jgi:toluene monooxygenase system ferredoxin subunit